MVDSGACIDPNKVCWYAMAPTFGRESRAKEYLDSRGVRCYLPTKEVVDAKTKHIKEIPVVRGLLFVYTSESFLREICSDIPYLYYKYVRYGQRSYKMTIPTKQMDSFLRVSSICSKDVIYVDPQRMGIDLGEGTPIRVHSTNSLFDGVEGIYIKIKGRRSKHLVISLNGLLTVAAMVDVTLIEKI
ncbi:MAG: transcription termination/antitermination NusG family protein [Rikenellaceae bacterium]